MDAYTQKRKKLQHQQKIQKLQKLQILQIETQLAIHGAPVLSGLKVSNLIMIPNQWKDAISWILKDTHLKLYLLYIGEEKSALFMYHPQQLAQYLMQPQTFGMLRKMGYVETSFEGLVTKLAERYTDFRHGKRGFPHEMGLFLGYPTEDVKGFIENKGKNFLYAGYWKVYEDIAQKIQLFQAFDKARETLLGLMANGFRMQEICHDMAH